MLDIRPLVDKEIPALVKLARTTFIQSHGHSASESDILTYIDLKITEDAFRDEFKNPSNHFYLLYKDEKLIGYSKICIDSPYKKIESPSITKLERIYLLEEYLGQGLGLELLNVNIQISKKLQQEGMWLYVWIENTRGINFYTKAGFTVISHEDFMISSTHSNPNHIMYLNYYKYEGIH